MRALLLGSLLFAFAAHAEPNYKQIQNDVINDVKLMVAADTTNEVINPGETKKTGNETRAAMILKARLEAAGIPTVLVGAEEHRQTLVARLKGNGSKKAMLFMSHSDVVPSEGQAWSPDTPPHVGTIKVENGVEYLYGRGTLDCLSTAAVAAELMISIKKSGEVLDRDLVLMMEADEERGGNRGAKWVLDNRPDLLNGVEFALNEGGFSFLSPNGDAGMFAVSPAEKVYMDYKIVVKNVAGGPSWRAFRPNAIFYISKGVSKIYDIPYPLMLSPLTMEYFSVMAGLEQDPKIKAALKEMATGKPSQATTDFLYSTQSYNSALHTTCAPTIFKSGLAPNILATEAEVNVNCRIMPGMTEKEVRDGLEAALKADDELKPLFETPPGEKLPYLQIQPDFSWGGESPMSRLDGPVMKAIRELALENYKGVPVVPTLLVAASDSRFTRIHNIDTYGVGSVLVTQGEINRVHGANERIPTSGIGQGARFINLLIHKLSATKQK